MHPRLGHIASVQKLAGMHMKQHSILLFIAFLLMSVYCHKEYRGKEDHRKKEVYYYYYCTTAVQKNAAGTFVGSCKGVWSTNNQSISYDDI